MSLSNNSSIMSDENNHFLSLTSFRIAHNHLLQQYREQGNASDVLHEIAQLIDNGKSIGKLLDSDNDRWACQGLLDYWSSMLYRAGYEHSNATLNEFDPTFAPDLDDSLYPYTDIVEQNQADTLSAAELRTAIEKPAELIGLKFEEGLLDALVQDTLYESNKLSLLQFILFKLWRQRDHNKITWESYHQIGRGQQALIKAANELVEGSSLEELQVLKQIMLNLAQFGVGAGLIARKISRSELYESLGVSSLTSYVEVNSLGMAPKEVHHSSELAENLMSITDSASNELHPELSQFLQTLTSETPCHFESHVPLMQDRFQALLKMRLSHEISLNPPLFPWETRIEDMMEEEAIEKVIPKINAPGFWIPQLANLQLPVLMSTDVLEKLLESCQSLLISPLREGAKLVQVVESIFPGEAATLNQLAGLVMTSPTRSGNRIMELAKSVDFPEHYDSASPSQQMVLSLLAAREIFSLFVFHLSSQKSVIKHRWETVIGAIALRISYKSNQLLLVETKFPNGGKLALYDGTANSIAQRSNPGYLSVSLANPSLGKPYPVEIQLDVPSHPSITFIIQLD